VKCNYSAFFLIISSFSLQSGLFYLLIVGVDVFCWTWSHSVTHTQTLGRIPLDVGSARRRDLHLTNRSTHKRQTSVPPAWFEPTIPAGWAAADPHHRPRSHRNRTQFFIRIQKTVYFSTLRNAHTYMSLSNNPQFRI